MIEIRLGDRYAKSIFDLATERGEVESVRADFDLFTAVCQSNPDFVIMLRSPVIPADKKQNILNAVFGKKLSVITSTLIEIIVRKRREKYLPDIANRFNVMYDTSQNIIRGVITSATPLSEAQRASIRALVEKELNTQFVMEEKLDESLIGGFSLRVGDYLHDGSVASTLRKLSQEFDKNPYIKLQ